MKRIDLKFYVNAHDSYSLAADESIEATVPGAAQLDYAKSAGLPDYAYSDNYKQYVFLEDKFFLYSARLPEKRGAGKRLFVYFGGIDYRYEIFLGDEKIYEYEGMFRPAKIELTDMDYAGKLLKVLIYPVPKRAGAPAGRWEADNVAKPAVSYGWDWHPRLIPSGIWQESYLIEEDSEYIGDFHPSYRLNDGLTEARLLLNLPPLPEGSVKVTVTDDRGKALKFSFAAGENPELTIPSPRLWWPHEYGEQSLYTVEVELVTGGKSRDKKSKRVGFRRARLVPQESNWNIDKFPFTQALPPVTLEINGRQIFGKGSNLVNAEIYFGLINRKSYEDLLTLAKGANMNLLRIWGGSIVNKDVFFELCDEMGIMVWQEFPLACNCYKDDDRYLSVMESESGYIVENLRKHPSLVIWCGGNELYTGGSSMTEQFKVLRLLNSQCYRLDPETPFLYTSPIMGVRHGHYRFAYSNDVECFEGFQKTPATAYCEFGCPAASDIDYLEKFIPPEEMSLENMGKSWMAHHGLEAWEKDSWLHVDVVKRYFGKCGGLADIVEKSQILQRAGYKGMFEEGRRQKPDCSMTLNWCLNEPWPTAANNSLINYPARPKDALRHVAKSLQPVVMSARVKKFSFQEGERFEAELFLLNDLYKSFERLTVRAYLRFNGTQKELLEFTFKDIGENQNAVGPVIRTALPHYGRSGIMRLVLECDEYPEAGNEYEFMYYNAQTIELMRKADAEPMDFVGISNKTGNFNNIDLELFGADNREDK